MRNAEDTAKLEVLREAARVGVAALDRGEFKEFEDIEDLQSYLNGLSEKVISGTVRIELHRRAKMARSSWRPRRSRFRKHYSSDCGPSRAKKLQAHAGSLHVAVAGRERLGSAEDEIYPAAVGVPDAPPAQGELKPASAKRWIGCRVRQIADPVMEIEGRCCGRTPIYSCEIERPSRLIEPGSDIGLELDLILFGNAPSGDIGVEILLHLFGRPNTLDIESTLGGSREIGLPDQAGMVRGLE